MEDINEQQDEFFENTQDENLKFTCPNCGELERDDVLFVCNTCKEEELISKNGVYMCPSCLTPGENFECRKCGSLDVKMTVLD